MCGLLQVKRFSEILPTSTRLVFLFLCWEIDACRLYALWVSFVLFSNCLLLVHLGFPREWWCACGRVRMCAGGWVVSESGV